MTHRARLTTVESVVEFIQAGNVTFTLVGRDNRFTYKVRKSTYKMYESQDGGTFFVSVLTGSDNESDYQYLGYMRDGVFRHGGAKARIGVEALSHLAFSWFWRMIQRGALPPTVEFWHEGKCGRCGRKLTVPSSVELGIGPECANMLAA